MFKNFKRSGRWPPLKSTSLEDDLNSLKSAKHALLTLMKVEQIRIKSFDANSASTG
jgi:hypothetical protein